MATAAAFAGLSVLARFAGIAMVGAGAAVLAWRGTRARRARLRDAVVFVAIAAVPFAWWTLSARFGGASPTDRAVEWHPITSEQAGEAVRTFGSWLIGARVADDTAQVLACIVLAGAAVLATTFGVLRARRRPAGAPGTFHRETLVVLLATAASNAVVVLVTVSLLDRTTPLSARILAPVYVCLLPVGAVALDVLVRRSGAARVVAVAALLAIVGVRGVDVARTVEEHDETRLRWAAPVWDESPVLRAVDALPDGTRVWSNVPDLVWYRTDVPAYRVTKVRVTGYRGGARLPGSAAALDRLHDQVARAGGVVVVVTGLSFRGELASPSELEAHGFERVETHPDGVVLRPQP